jgi:hypothetical protein
VPTAASTASTSATGATGSSAENSENSALFNVDAEVLAAQRRERVRQEQLARRQGQVSNVEVSSCARDRQ